mmetsp:Transcript_6856/g.19316  ORF Transcript_6856/g.19316 Transcript_6856/m.19316 type:complete len:246 (-) Transcript_6856:295-1032(-)
MPTSAASLANDHHDLIILVISCSRSSALAGGRCPPWSEARRLLLSGTGAGGSWRKTCGRPSRSRPRPPRPRCRRERLEPHPRLPSSRPSGWCCAATGSPARCRLPRGSQRRSAAACPGPPLFSPPAAPAASPSGPARARGRRPWRSTRARSTRGCPGPCLWRALSGSAAPCPHRCTPCTCPRSASCRWPTGRRCPPLRKISSSRLAGIPPCQGTASSLASPRTGQTSCPQPSGCSATPSGPTCSR